MSHNAPAHTPVPRWLATAAIAAVGALVGLGLYTFSYAEGASYFSNDPTSCMNCHVMRAEFDSWNRGSHHAVAACNDCHTPHTFPGKYIVKGINGWNHSLAFTTGNYPDPIRIRSFNAGVAQANCVECHATTVSAIHAPGDTEGACSRCHGNVGHSR